MPVSILSIKAVSSRSTIPGSTTARRASFSRPGTTRAFGCGTSPIRSYRGRLDTTCPRDMHLSDMLTGKAGRCSRTRIPILFT